MTETARPFDSFNENGVGPFVIVCDHAGDLGADEFAYDATTAPTFGERCDVGASRLAQHLARLLDAPAVLQPNSRQVVDCARPTDDPAFVLNNGEPNAAARRNALNASIVQPYYAEIRDRLAILSRQRPGQHILVVSVHTVADERLSRGSVLLAERSEPEEPARMQALSILRERLDKQGLLGMPKSGEPPFAGEHLALSSQAGASTQTDVAASSLIIKVARTQAADRHTVECIAGALRDASKAAETERWTFQRRRLPQVTRKLASKVVAGVVAVVGIVPLVTFVIDKWPEGSAQYRLVVDQRLVSTVDVPIGPSATIRLGRINPKAKTVSYPEALTCTPTEDSAVLQTIVARGTEDGCTFKVTGSRVLFAHSTAPQPVDFALTVLDENKRTVAVPAIKLILRDIPIPSPTASVDSVEAGRPFDVTLEPEPGGEDVRFTACAWLPAQYVLSAAPVGNGCRATVQAPAAPGPAKNLSLFARVTATGGAGSFVLNSNEIVVPITPRLHEPAPAIAATQAVRAPVSRTVPAAVGQPPVALAPVSIAPAIIPAALPQVAPIGPITPPSNVTVGKLVDALRDTRDNDRYLALRDGLATLDPGVRLAPEEALRLLGSLAGNLRMRALTNWVLPRIATPMPAAGGEQLIASLAPFDRVALLHDLGGCALAPLTEQQQAQLLSGIFGIARERATAALAARDGDCGKAITDGR